MRLIVEAEAEVEEGWEREDVEGRGENEADILESCWVARRVRHLAYATRDHVRA